MWAVTPQADFNAQADKSIAFDFKCKHIYCLVVLCFWTDCDLLVFLMITYLQFNGNITTNLPGFPQCVLIQRSLVDNSKRLLIY